MRKRIFVTILAIVLALALGISGASAYESHVVNVKAQIENALCVGTNAIHFGPVFPEEWITRDFTVSMSRSFCSQWRVTGIEYDIQAGWKPIPNSDQYYEWLGDAIYIGINAENKWPEAAGGDLVWVGEDPPPGPPGSILMLSSGHPGLFKYLPEKPTDCHTITIGLDVPVFEGYYNELTDVAITPAGLTHPTVIIGEDEPRWWPQRGITLGMDIKIQVTNIYLYE